MVLRLEVLRYRGLPPEQPLGLAHRGGACTLGRSPDNDLALVDPERLVSSHHADIEMRGDGVWIIDRSTNGTFLNGSPERLPAGQPVELHTGDTLAVGPYEIAVAIDQDQDLAAPDPFALDQEPLPGMVGPGPAPDIMELLGGSGGEPPGADRVPVADPFADARPLDPFLAGPAPQEDGPRAAEPRPTPVEHVFFRPPESQPIPEGYDLLRDELPIAPATPNWEPAPAEGPEPGPESEPPVMPPGSAAPGAATDWRLDLSPAEESDRPPPPPVIPTPGPAGPRPGLGESLAPEVPPEPRSEVSEPPPRTGPQSPPGDLLAAFLAGLGTGEPDQVKDPAALLRDSGALLRALTAGLAATLMARAQFKSELRLGVTTIRRAENNPFKFSVSPDEALERLLLRPNPAYLAPLDAARGAFADIQAHEMAMIAGLRAALRALLARFEPSALEARLSSASGLDRLLPMARKSRYWDLFTQTYGQVAADATEDFMQLFGEAFTRAYEDQILRLGQARGRHTPA
ncbi:MAG: type VI secretion system-associated FHA domain protein TagH [Bdellovibrio bacteriovorus]